MKPVIERTQSIIPPFVLESIIANGTPAQSQRATQTQASSQQIRQARRVLSAVAAAPQAAATAAKQRTVYTANHGTTLPGQLVRREGDPTTSDAAANEAYDGAGATYDLYFDIYGRNSLDNKGLPLNSSVHYQTQYDNAFWNGEQMVYGDGDESLPASEQLFNRFTIAIDVIGHELTHGVTQYTANLDYSQQPGALNESFSDVFGSLVKQRNLNQTAAQADWLIGQGLFTANVKGQALRSMKAPGTAYNDPVLGKDPQPANMSGYVTTTQDDGGVHINSGIPNHAFYLAAIQIGGNAWEKAGRIWYVTLRDKLTASSNFQDAANKTTQTAGELYGTDSPEQQAVRNAWSQVGIATTTGTGTGTGTTNAGCLPTAVGALRSILGLGASHQ